jgi:predicted metalloprotease
MRWEDWRRSDNVEDRRGEEGGEGGGYSGPGGFQLPGGRGGLGIGTIVVLGLLGWALGIDPRLLIGGAEILVGGGPSYQAPYQDSPRPGPSRQGPAKTGAPSDQMGMFVASVLGETEDRWKEIFQRANQRYREPKLVMFSGATRSACGFAQSAMGPFYCPSEQKVYLDTSFFRDLERRFRACDAGSKACQFSQAYVIAHEVGHHVQNLLGILPKVQQMQRGVSKAEGNQLQVRVELQADSFAGVWAHHSEQKWKFLEPGDIDAALKTAAAIGDDRLQKQTQGYVVPESFTHGSSQQRMRWFQIGLKQGTVAACNTFDKANL